jgi:proteasome accessory factor A
MLLITRGAMDASNRRMSEGQGLEVLANTSDGQGNSYGSHLSFLVKRRTWDALFRRQLHHMLFLASYQVSSIIFTGQGKVGSENGRPGVEYQISQRADFFETLTGTQTTHRRPIVNSRDEALCTGDLARLHVIFYDSTLCHVATFLKVGVLQVVLAMVEAGRIQPRLILDDPLRAIRTWSDDRSLRARATLVSGKRLTAIEHQLLFCEEAEKFVEAGGCEGSVPEAPEILRLWRDTLEKLRVHDFESLATRLDWVLKLSLLERLLAQRPEIGWDSPELKHLDQVYSSLDRERGLYWACERGCWVERMVGDEAIEYFVENPPVDTRAYIRAHALRSLEPHDIQEVNWERIRFRSATLPHREWVIDLGNPMEQELIKRPARVGNEGDRFREDS